MWVPFDTFGEIRGRVRGMSLPYPNGQVLVWTDQGLFSLWYFRSAFINKLLPTAAGGHINPATGSMTWNGIEYPMFGPHTPQNDSRTQARHPSGERVTIDPADGVVHVLDAAGAVQQIVDAVDAGEWAMAAFSVDGKALVVADTTSVRVFRYEATTGSERPRWAALANEGDQNQLLQAILANPDEDTPRLIYADWLDEHDDPARAEFIRVQCRIAARLPHETSPTDPDHQRELQLVSQMSERWLAELSTVRGVRWIGFWRGFPSVSVISPTTLVRAAPKIWSTAPVEWATITGLNQNGARLLADSEVFDRLRAIEIDRYAIQRDGEKPLRTLFHAPRAVALKRLYLPQGVGEPGLIAVISSPHLTGLEWLTIGAGTLTNTAAEVLMTAPGLQNLRGGSFVSHRLSDTFRKRLKDRFPNAIV